MPTLQDTQAKIDSVVTSIFPELESQQASYFAKHNKYFQILISPQTKVTDGVDTAFTLRKPLDEKSPTDVSLNWPTDVPCQVEVHENFGGKGEAGFTMVLTVTVDGKEYRKKVGNKGGETVDWFEVPQRPL